MCGDACIVSADRSIACFFTASNSAYSILRSIHVPPPNPRTALLHLPPTCCLAYCLQEEEFRKRQAEEEGKQLHAGLSSVPLPKPPPLPAGPKPGLPPPPGAPPLPAGPAPTAAAAGAAGVWQHEPLLCLVHWSQLACSYGCSKIVSLRLVIGVVHRFAVSSCKGIIRS